MPKLVRVDVHMTIRNGDRARTASLTALRRTGRKVTRYGLGTLLFLTGCVDQQKEIAQYRAVLEADSIPATQPAGRSMERDKMLTLTEALALTNRDNERLALAGEEYLQALINKDRVFATFLPTVTLVPGTLLQESVGGPTPGRAAHVAGALSLPGAPPPVAAVPNHTFDLPVKVDINLNAYRDAARLQAADLTAAQRRELLLDLQAAVLLETAHAYYGVLKAERAVVVLENSLSVQELRVRDVEDKVRHGVARQLDLEQSRAQAARTRVQLTDARNLVATGRVTLAFLIGVPAVRAQLVDAVRPGLQDETLEALLATAQEQRRDLQAAALAVAAARQSVEAAIGQWFPAVTIDLNAFLYRESFPSASSFSAVVGVNLPLFTGGRIYADVREAWSRHRQAQFSASLLTRQVAEQVERAYDDYRTQRQRIVDLETEVAAARETFRIASESYETGLATNLDRLDAQDRLLSAELRLESSRYDVITAYLNLVRLTGRMSTAVAEGEAYQSRD